MRYTDIAPATPLQIGRGFEADQFSFSDFPGSAMSPFVMVDHFWMNSLTFDEHPHAGISAVTLMLEDTTCDMLSIDSLAHFSRFGAGDMHWTLAGRGIMHNQMPASTQGVIHALQIFVNLPPDKKDMAADSFKVAADTIPIVTVDGARVRVVAGSYGGCTSPAPTPQPVMMLDVTAIDGTKPFKLPLAPKTNALVVSILGEISISDGRALRGREAVVCSTDEAPEVLHLTPRKGAHFVILSGPNDPSEIFTNGPFVYGSLLDLRQAEARFLAGEFGRCPTLGDVALATDY